MPKRNTKLFHFLHVFTQEEAAALMFQIRTLFCKRNVKDALIMSNVCDTLARENLKNTGDPRWTEEAVKVFITNNIRLYPLFIKYINESFGLKYNPKKNRVYVSPEYWQVKSKETKTETLFRELGYPLFEEWSPILEAHTPAQALAVPVGSSPIAPIVVKDEPFEEGAVDDAEVRRLRLRVKDGPIHDSKISTL